MLDWFPRILLLLYMKQSRSAVVGTDEEGAVACRLPETLAFPRGLSLDEPPPQPVITKTQCRSTLARRFRARWFWPWRPMHFKSLCFRCLLTAFYLPLMMRLILRSQPC